MAVRCARPSTGSGEEMYRDLRAAVIVAALGAAAACSDGPLAPPAPITDLPPDLAAITFTAEGTPTAPFTMLELRQTGGFSGFVAVDAAGRPVLVFPPPGTPAGFTPPPHR